MDQAQKRARASRYLEQALIDLGAEKSIYGVSVTELCHKAQVNRTTFYKHYENMTVFIDSVTEAFLIDMNLAVECDNPYREMLLMQDPTPILMKCVSFMDVKADFLGLMLGRNGSADFQNKIRGVWKGQIREAIEPYAGQIDNAIDIEILVCFVAFSMWALLDYHIMTNRMYSQTYIAGQLKALLVEHGLGSLGLRQLPVL
jgi:AcrR family transcriptional regulator